MDSQIKTIILLIVRHGNTDANVKRIIHGWVDTPLNDTGSKQAKEAGKALKNVLFHQAYSSDLQRANKTCQIILAENKKSSINSEHIIKDELLREQNFGIFENESYDVENAAVKKYGANFTPENGESDITGNFFRLPIIKIFFIPLTYKFSI
jgi:broad specificity phosphatase PhoE